MGTETVERKMIPIALTEFLNGMVAPADLYLKFSSGRPMLLFKVGTKFDHERLKKYQGKNVTHLWVYFEDFQEVCDAAIDIANTGVSQGFLNITKKTFLVSNAAQSIYRSFEAIGLDLSVYDQAKKTTEAVLQIAKADFDIQTLVNMLYETNDYLTSHSVATSILAPAIGQAAGMETDASLHKLALGGFFHDIGKLQIPPELLEKPISQFNNDDLKEYHQHCARGAEMLKSLQLNSEDLMNIVFQHHERNDGTGYPQRLKGPKIHPLAKIVGLASEFLNLIVPNPKFNCKQYTPEEALSLLRGGMGMPFDKAHIEALQSIVMRKENEKEAS